MNRELTLGSLFDGSGGFPLAALSCGIKPIWASEVEPFPIRVTQKNLACVKHLGDIKDINGYEIETVDIISFGSPCQDLSLAGKRAGLEGKKSSLFYEAIRVIKEMRCRTNGKYPRYLLWENVPGAFSSNKGEDFRSVLEEITKINESKVKLPRPKKWNNAGEILGDNYTIAWRVLDAKYFGVPQRRTRIFLVADLNGTSASQILFEQKRLSWDISESKKKGKTNTKATERCTYKTDNLSEVNGSKKTFLAYDIRQTSENTKNERHNIYECDTSRTIDTSGNTPIRNQGGVAIIEEVYSMSKNNHFTKADKNISSSLVATDYKDPPLVNQRIIRRLTPKECGRLQGFPDYWCEDLGIDSPSDKDLLFWRSVFDKDAEIRGLTFKKTDKQIIKWLKNPHTDSAEYKMWGNGIALPCAIFIFKRLVNIAK